jgi:putative DNA primase/helicase
MTTHLEAAAKKIGVVPPADDTGTSSPPQPVEEEAPKKKTRRLQGKAPKLHEPQPWSEEVDGAELLDGLAAAVKRYVVCSEHQRNAVALWVIHAYTIDAFQVSPILSITSATKRCGKTTLIDVLKSLVSKPKMASNMTPAVLFRSIEMHQPCLLLDEADTLKLSDHHELRGMLNAGHLRSGAVVMRTVGDDYEPREFTVWCPKAVACIGSLPDVLVDRSLVIDLKRKPSGAGTERMRRADLTPGGVNEDLRRQAARWSADHLDVLRDYRPAIPEGLNDREADNWEPLLAIADLAGGEWPEKAREAARVLSDAAEGTEEITVTLLRDLAAIFAEIADGFMPTQDILDELNGLDERPWSTWRRGQPLNANTLAKLLKPFGLHPDQVRYGKDVVRGYTPADFGEVFRVYLPETVTTVSSVTPQVDDDQDCNGCSDCNALSERVEVEATQPELVTTFPAGRLSQAHEEYLRGLSREWQVFFRDWLEWEAAGFEGAGPVRPEQVA